MNPADATVVQDDGVGEGEKFEVGKTFTVTLTTGDKFKGIVLAYDSDLNIVIFQEGTMSKAVDSITTRMVYAKFISELSSIAKSKDPLAKKNRSVDLERLKVKEKVAISRIESIGVGVTAEAQSIFDALSKTLPVKWDKKDILVMGVVRICSPYDSDCVIGGTPAANSRVKKMLKLEREKLQLGGTGGN